MNNQFQYGAPMPIYDPITILTELVFYIFVIVSWSSYAICIIRNYKKQQFFKNLFLATMIHGVVSTAILMVIVNLVVVLTKISAYFYLLGLVALCIIPVITPTVVKFKSSTRYVNFNLATTLFLYTIVVYILLRFLIV